VTRRVPVPQTLLSLRVKLMRRPSKVVRRVDGNTGHPREHYSDNSSTAGKDGVVSFVPADVNVTVDCDESDCKQRHDTADDAEAGRRRTQPLVSFDQPTLSHHHTCIATLTVNLAIKLPVCCLPVDGFGVWSLV